MGAAGKVHHEGTKGAKMRCIDIIRPLGGPTLITVMLAMLCSPLRAGDPIDKNTLQLAQRKAVSRWEGALPDAMGSSSAGRDMPRGVVGTLTWDEGVAGIVSYDLLRANPDREADILIYVNTVLVPEMRVRRNAYMCGFTKLYYGLGITWMRLRGMVDLPDFDQFVTVAYFVAPTRGYLDKHGLSFTPRTAQSLDRYGRFAPDGSFWEGVVASSDRIPCEDFADAESTPAGAL